jgi:hypothetical protein
VSKKFGEWYQKTNKTEDTNKNFGEWYQKTNKTEDTNKLTLFVSSVLFVSWYHSPNFLDTPHICDISRLRVNKQGWGGGGLQELSDIKLVPRLTLANTTFILGYRKIQETS